MILDLTINELENLFNKVNDKNWFADYIWSEISSIGGDNL